MPQDDLSLPRLFQIYECYVAAPDEAEALRFWRRGGPWQGGNRRPAHAGNVVEVEHQELDGFFPGATLTVDALAQKVEREDPPFLFVEHED